MVKAKGQALPRTSSAISSGGPGLFFKSLFLAPVQKSCGSRIAMPWVPAQRLPLAPSCCPVSKRTLRSATKRSWVWVPGRASQAAKPQGCRVLASCRCNTPASSLLTYFAVGSIRRRLSGEERTPGRSLGPTPNAEPFPWVTGDSGFRIRLMRGNSHGARQGQCVVWGCTQRTRASEPPREIPNIIDSKRWDLLAGTRETRPELPSLREHSASKGCIHALS